VVAKDLNMPVCFQNPPPFPDMRPCWGLHAQRTPREGLSLLWNEEVGWASITKSKKVTFLLNHFLQDLIRTHLHLQGVRTGYE
jgi:hypothetical protein